MLKTHFVERADFYFNWANVNYAYTSADWRITWFYGSERRKKCKGKEAILFNITTKCRGP